MFKLKKSLGQNFLIDKNIINKILSVEKLRNQNVIEIGPGSGNLSKMIIQKEVNKFLAIEKDERFCDLLDKKYADNNNINIHNKFLLFIGIYTACNVNQYFQ